VNKTSKHAVHKASVDKRKRGTEPVNRKQHNNERKAVDEATKSESELERTTNQRRAHQSGISYKNFVTQSSEYASKGLRRIVAMMRPDEVTQTIQRDALIMKFGERIYKKHGYARTKHHIIRAQMRDLGKLLLHMQAQHTKHHRRQRTEVTGARHSQPVPTLADYLQPSKFKVRFLYYFLSTLMHLQLCKDSLID
jgi:hypothetical protein